MGVDKVIISELKRDVMKLYGDSNVPMDVTPGQASHIEFEYCIGGHWFKSSTDLITEKWMSLAGMEETIKEIMNKSKY